MATSFVGLFGLAMAVVIKYVYLCIDGVDNEFNAMAPIVEDTP